MPEPARIALILAPAGVRRGIAIIADDFREVARNHRTVARNHRTVARDHRKVATFAESSPQCQLLRKSPHTRGPTEEKERGGGVIVDEQLR